MDMLSTVSQAFKVPEMRKKLIFTLLMLVIFKIGSDIPVPGIDATYLQQIFNGQTGIFELFNLFSGGAFSNFTIFALSITPYITASIIVQLLTVAFPYFQNLSKEGQAGRKKMATITRYGTVVLALVQGIGLTIGLFRKAVIDTSFFSVTVIVLVLTAGTTFLMWLGEQINEKGVGNGISLVIFAGIAARIPSYASELWNKYQEGGINIITLILFVLFAVVVVLGIIEVQQGTRRIPVQYAKRVVGRKMYGGQATHIPLKVNQAGVIPVIFAMSLLQFPLTITYFLDADSGFTQFVNKYLSVGGSPGVWVYSVLNILLIMFFTYFYTAVTFNPVEVADNMKANGGFIPGIRPGKNTVEYLNKVMGRVCFVGGIFLAIVAIMPTLVSNALDLHNFKFGGTSLLIIVGVALDTMRQLESKMIMRNYHGFLDK